MKKSLVAAGLVGSAVIAVKLLKDKEKVRSPFSLIQEKLENSGYEVSKTKDKGVFLLEKNGSKSFLIYDNIHFSRNTLFNLLNIYKEHFSPHLYIISDTTNSLYGKTKTLFNRWVSTEHHSNLPLMVHFSTVQKFKEEDEPTWESTQI